MLTNPLYAAELMDMPEITAESQQRFQITDIHSLSWALRKMAAITAKKSDVNELAYNEVARIEAFRKHEIDALQRDEDFFRGLISEYAIRRRDEDADYKGDKTPYGKIGFRKQQPKYHYQDEELVSFLELNGHSSFIRIKKEPVKTEIKKLFKVNTDGRVFDENGQEVSGIRVEFLPDVLDVKVEV